MIKTVAIGLWVCAVTVGAGYVGTVWQFGDGQAAKQKRPTALSKLKPISVPVVRDGKIAGYVVVQFSSVSEADVLKVLTVKPDAFLIDAIYKGLYGRPEADLTQLAKEDWTALATSAKEAVNAHYGSSVVQDLLLDEFGYVPAGTIRKDTSPAPKKKESKASGGH